MTVQLIQPYLVAFGGLAVGAALGVLVAVRFRRRLAWDMKVAITLMLATAGAHISLIPEVETLRQVSFALYGAALIGTVLVALAGLGIWRAGGVIFPVGSIAGYFYFALPEHHADYVGLFVKLVELAAIVVALIPVVSNRAQPAKRIAA